MTKFSLSIKATLTALLGVFLLGWAPARAQVAVDLPDVTHQAGTSPLVPVTVGDLTDLGVTSYQFVVTFDEAVVNITDASFAGTLSDVQGARVEINATVPGQLTVSYAASVELAGAGTLINLQATAVGDGASDLAFDSFVFNEGVPDDVTTAGSFTVPALAVYITHNNSGSEGVATQVPVFVDDLTSLGVFSYEMDISYDPEVVEVTGVSFAGTVSEGGGLSYSLGQSTGMITLSAARNTVMEGSGVLFYLDVVGVGEGTSDLAFERIFFNEGDPEVGGINGSIMISANLAPVFDGSPDDATILETETFAYTFSASDPEGEDVTLSLTVGDGTENVSFDAGTGEFSFTPDLTQAGSYTFTVAASDGAISSSVSFTVNVLNLTETYEATLAAVNVVPADGTTFVYSPGAGQVGLVLDEGEGTVVLTGSVSGLSAAFTAVHIHSGGVGANGGVTQGLTLNVDGTGRAGSFDAVDNTYAVDAAFISALQAGDLYVNVHTAAHTGGEIRGQLLSSPNAAPGATNSRSPASVTIAGDGGNPLVNVSWTSATDPNGDTVNYIFEVAMDAAFTQGVMFRAFGDVNGFQLTVADAAQLYDGLPGNSGLGGSATLYHRVITTDGSLWTVGPSASITLTRGQVTANENEYGIPTEFTLQGNYPNPFNPSTSIRFDLPESANVSVAIVDMLGRQVMSVPAQQVAAGSSRVLQVDASALSSGTYLYRVTARGANSTHVATGTMTLIK